MSSPSPRTAAPASRIDPRGPQLGAAITSVVLAVVLLTAPGGFATVLLAAQTAVFAVGALGGVQRTPQAWVFRRLIRPHLGAPTETEDAAPPRFAQAVGLVFSAVGLLGLLSGATALGLVAVGAALSAALLNAAFGLCLGCELYLTVKRLSPAAG